MENRLPSERERIFAEAKLEGKNNADAAMVAAPNISRSSAYKVGNRLINRPSVQDLIVKAMRKYDITPRKLIQTVAEALNATKETKDGDTIPDHSVRLKAADMGLKLIGALKQDRDQPPIPTAQLSNRELSNALQSNDEVELQRILFKKAE